MHQSTSGRSRGEAAEIGSVTARAVGFFGGAPYDIGWEPRRHRHDPFGHRLEPTHSSAVHKKWKVGADGFIGGAPFDIGSVQRRGRRDPFGLGFEPSSSSAAHNARRVGAVTDPL